MFGHWETFTGLVGTYARLCADIHCNIDIDSIGLISKYNSTYSKCKLFQGSTEIMYRVFGP